MKSCLKKSVLVLAVLIIVCSLSGCSTRRQAFTSKSQVKEYLETELGLSDYTLNRHKQKHVSRAESSVPHNGDLILYTVTEQDGTVFTAYDYSYTSDAGGCPQRYRIISSDYDVVHLEKYMKQYSGKYGEILRVKHQHRIDETVKEPVWLLFRFKNREELKEAVDALNTISKECVSGIELQFLFQFDDEEFLTHNDSSDAVLQAIHGITPYDFDSDPDFPQDERGNVTFRAGDVLNVSLVEKAFARYGAALQREDVMRQFTDEEIATAIKEYYDLMYDPIVIKSGGEYIIFKDAVEGGSDDCSDVSAACLKHVLETLGYDVTGDNWNWTAKIEDTTVEFSESFDGYYKVNGEEHECMTNNGYQAVYARDNSFDLYKYSKCSYQWSAIYEVPLQQLQDEGFVAEIARRKWAESTRQ